MAKKGEWILYRNKITGQCTAYQPYGIEAVNFEEVKAKDASFKTVLRFDRCYNGHSWFQDLERPGFTYMMQEAALTRMLRKASLEKGVVFGHWGWIKNGNTLSIELLEELEDDNDL